MTMTTTMMMNPTRPMTTMTTKTTKTMKKKTTTTKNGRLNMNRIQTYQH